MTALAGATLVLAVWLAASVARKVVERAGERLAAWLLPEEQSWTYRLATAMLALASWIGPRAVGSPFSEAQPKPWVDPAAAREELHEDLRSGVRVIHPAALAAPLVRTALALRARQVWLRVLWVVLFPFLWALAHLFGPGLLREERSSIPPDPRSRRERFRQWRKR